MHGWFKGNRKTEAVLGDPFDNRFARKGCGLAIWWFDGETRWLPFQFCPLQEPGTHQPKQGLPQVTPAIDLLQLPCAQSTLAGFWGGILETKASSRSCRPFPEPLNLIRTRRVRVQKHRHDTKTPGMEGNQHTCLRNYSRNLSLSDSGSPLKWQIQ